MLKLNELIQTSGREKKNPFPKIQAPNRMNNPLRKNEKYIHIGAHTSGTNPMAFIWSVKNKASCIRPPFKEAITSEWNVSLLGCTPSSAISS